VRVQLDLGDESCVVASDRTPLEQVVLNLVLNARDAMPGGGTVHVRVARDDRRGVARLVVADDGIGMDEATRSRIFEPFFTTKAPGQGTGLGLAVVQGIVIDLGGTVHVASQPGKGSTFTVELPLATVDLVPPRGEGDVSPRRTGCVLLVDDEPLVRSTTRRMLERAGWQVLEAGNGEEGWRVWQAQRATIQVVLTDVRMPVLDGVRMAARIAEASPELPIVFVSGWEGHDGATRVPPDATLVQKPFDAGRLLDVLTRATRTDGVAG
jgi:CheY-like chemotaxis protein/anti-sigma regulatory factor (Ser/Thr protein kinase)